VARRKDTVPALSAPRGSHRFAFVVDGKVHPVNINGPRSVWRAGRRMVPLIDLWVATLLPFDVLDLTFQVVARRPETGRTREYSMDALCFARGFLALRTRELWWDDQRVGTPHGWTASSVMARVGAGDTPVLGPAPVHGPPPTLADGARGLLEVTLANLQRLLPHAALGYPAVAVRTLP
jgi:hypothetical protein